jgi:hypothetical protein
MGSNSGASITVNGNINFPLTATISTSGGSLGDLKLIPDKDLVLSPNSGTVKVNGTILIATGGFSLASELTALILNAGNAQIIVNPTLMQFSFDSSITTATGDLELKPAAGFFLNIKSSVTVTEHILTKAAAAPFVSLTGGTFLSSIVHAGSTDMAGEISITANVGAFFVELTFAVVFPTVNVFPTLAYRNQNAATGLLNVSSIDDTKMTISGVSPASPTTMIVSWHVIGHK